MSGAHDGIYRRLFSHPALIEDLIRHALGVEALERLRVDTLEPVPAHYVSDELQQREDDVVWRLRRASGLDGDWFYIYVLVEFQSSVDRFMALRVMTYLGLLYEDLARRRELDRRGLLPPVLPIVLYNGDASWSAPTDVESLLRLDEDLARYRPRLQYLLVDEVRESLEQVPASRPLHAVLELEQAQSVAALVDALRGAVDVTEDLEDTELARDFETWLRRVLIPTRFPDLKGQPIGGLRAMQTRLERTVQGWTQDWLEQGRSEGLSQGLEQGLSQGLEQGRADGQRRGQARSLVQLLELKFGELSAATRRRVEAADSPTLERWTGRVLAAASVEEVVC